MQSNGNVAARKLRGNWAEKFYCDISVTLGDSPQSGTGLPGLEQDIRAVKTKNILGEYLRVTFPENTDAIHSTSLEDRRLSPKNHGRDSDDIQRNIRL
jgi:hypothetical protein